MKIKDTKETCGPLSREHAYLGHFRGVLSEGHNTNPLKGDEQTLKRMDENLGRVKRDEYWQGQVQQSQVRSQISKEVEAFAQQRKKEIK